MDVQHALDVPLASEIVCPKIPTATLALCQNGMSLYWCRAHSGAIVRREHSIPEREGGLGHLAWSTVQYRALRPQFETIGGHTRRLCEPKRPNILNGDATEIMYIEVMLS